MRWYYVVNGEVVGPVRTRYLSRILKQGLIDNKTYVYNKHVLKDWTRIKYVFDLIKDITCKNEKDRSEETRKRTRKYYREKAKRKQHEKEQAKNQFQKKKQKTKRWKKEESKAEDSEFAEPFDISDDSSSDDEQTVTTYRKSFSCKKPPSMSDQISRKQIPVKNGDWIETLTGEKGRVLYIGFVDGIPGKAVGVELMKPVGDCDGSHEGRRYFSCKKNHGQFILRRFIKNVILDPEIAKVSPYQGVVDDLNLNLEFDVVSFQLAVATLGFNYNFEEMTNVWDTWNAADQKCKTAADKLEILLSMLDSPSE